MTVKPIPDGYHTVTPYLTVRGAGQVVDFLVKAFEATLVHRMLGPDGRLSHADLMVGDSHVMIGEAREGFAPMPAALYLYVKDCDAVYRRAMAAGGQSVMEPTRMFYGDRHGGVRDSCGNLWWIATHVEDVSLQEIQHRELEQRKQLQQKSAG